VIKTLVAPQTARPIHRFLISTWRRIERSIPERHIIPALAQRGQRAFQYCPSDRLIRSSPPKANGYRRLVDARGAKRPLTHAAPDPALGLFS
jgi:hypothetical protein